MWHSPTQHSCCLQPPALIKLRGLLGTSRNSNIQKCGYILSLYIAFSHFINLLINSVSAESTCVCVCARACVREKQSIRTKSEHEASRIEKTFCKPVIDQWLPLPLWVLVFSQSPKEKTHSAP